MAVCSADESPRKNRGAKKRKERGIQAKSCRQFRSTEKDVIMDLNKLPPDFDFLDVDAANPSFCTQADLAGAGLGSCEQVQIADGRTLLTAGDAQNLVQSSPFPDTNQVAAASTEFADDNQVYGVADEVVEEVWCTPPVPYTGQTFASKAEAKSYYNTYAKRIGFSIHISSTRLSGLSREQHKVTCV